MIHKSNNFTIETKDSDLVLIQDDFIFINGKQYDPDFHKDIKVRYTPSFILRFSSVIMKIGILIITSAGINKFIEYYLYNQLLNITLGIIYSGISIFFILKLREINEHQRFFKKFK